MSVQNSTIPMPMPAYPHQPMLWLYQNIMIASFDRRVPAVSVLRHGQRQDILHSD
ncbi:MULTISPECIES: hypothetical protein [unclassified Mycolicibacterium]|nr:MULTISPECIES: hypothetical protein [unclassified Mycolicibacterium]